MTRHRRYTMVARAEATGRTRVRVIDALVELFMLRDFEAITLNDVAQRAGVTLQTVLRHFKSKDGLIDAATDHVARRVMSSRELPRGEGAAGAVRVLVASYEEMGDHNWRLLRYESQHPALRRVLDSARRLHREWLARVFRDVLPARGAERERRLDALFTATDFYSWKLHRMDLGRSRKETESTLLVLVQALLWKWGAR